jgi:hypothetical protein
VGGANGWRCSYSLRPIILFANIYVSRHLLVVDTSVLAKSNMGWREYQIFDTATMYYDTATRL